MGVAGIEPAGAVLLAVSKQQLAYIEIAIVVVVVALLVAILMVNRRRKRAEKAPAPQATGANYQDYYADLQQQGGGQLGGAPPDPFAGFGASAAVATGTRDATPAAPPANGAAQPVPAPAFQQSQVAAAPAASSAPSTPQGPAGVPAPGTPAGWLQDPSGAPDTLRYWDGSAWTQHVAQRT